MILVEYIVYIISYTPKHTEIYLSTIHKSIAYENKSFIVSDFRMQEIVRHKIQGDILHIVHRSTQISKCQKVVERQRCHKKDVICTKYVVRFKTTNNLRIIIVVFLEVLCYNGKHLHELIMSYE